MKIKRLNVDFPLELIEEGEVKVLVPKLKAFVERPNEYSPSKAPVFFNPVMEFNRDIAVLATQAYQRIVSRKISICEPLTGCGLRGIRFAKEVEGVKSVVINDINEKAYELAKYNVTANGLEGCILIYNEDANLLLSRYAAPGRRFDVIDIDPFGSPTPFMDSAVRALRNGGLMALTATDMAPLCGVYPKACIRKYGGKPLRTEYCHELAVRLLTGCLAVTAARHEMGIKPIFSHSTDHYVRVYATIKHGAKEADDSLSQMGYILHCFRCFHREIIARDEIIKDYRKCPECGAEMDYSGPLWTGKLYEKDFCNLLIKEIGMKKLGTKKRIQRILTLIAEELEAPATYYVLDKLCDKLRLPVPSIDRVVNLLKNRGFNASRTHFHPRGIKTNASALNMESLLKCIASS